MPEQSDEAEEWLFQENFRMRESAEAAINTANAIFAEKGILTRNRIVEGSPASEVIAQESLSGQYDLIVMASRGLGASRSERCYLGSVAENVLRKVTLPVLVIPIHSDGRLHLEQGEIVCK